MLCKTPCGVFGASQTPCGVFFLGLEFCYAKPHVGSLVLRKLRVITLKTVVPGSGANLCFFKLSENVTETFHIDETEITKMGEIAKKLLM